jgi:aminopeptidase N
MPDLSHQPVYLKDYRAPDYSVETIELRFELAETVTDVHSRLTISRNCRDACPLVLDGQDVELLALKMDGNTLPESEYHVDEKQLIIQRVPEKFELAVTTRIRPQENTSLEGLYRSGGNFCTQCEAEGFRKITYFPDRPDIMTVFTTTLAADKTDYPVLLSNGNLIDQGELDDGRHWATWHDPYNKPSYLFALVAGKLEFIEDRHTTRSGRNVTLRIYVEPENINQCDHAMRSLKKAMTWDEQVFGLEYDLDIYMIVAVGDFNMGAMENKGLNIFNTKYVLAKPDTATDSDYQGVEGVIAHEYFHNWTGNRVTCRDWFQLSLKEGLTVFRDQEFSADTGSRGVKRIDDVRILRSLQFTEDAGPMAHPVRPDSYIEINNFYTVTVYNKGAEIVRMIHTLLGQEGFRKGMDLYFERHDGQAVTCDDFVAAMEAANAADLGQLRRWYSQAGTPQLHIERHYDPVSETYTLDIKQSCPATPGQPEKAPFHIPLALGLLDARGAELPLQLEGENAPSEGKTRVLELRDTEQTFRFINIPQAPVPSLLRGFSAPVKLNVDYSDDELMFLLAHDSDEFNRWEAGQQLIIRTILGLLDQQKRGENWILDDRLVNAFRSALRSNADPALLAQLITLPSESYLAEHMEVVDVEGIHSTRRYLQQQLAHRLYDDLLNIYRTNTANAPYSIDTKAIGRRSLKNRCLEYLVQIDERPEMLELCLQQFHEANNMSDEIGALHILANRDFAQRDEALTRFYQRWRQEPLVVDKWFTLQAGAALSDALQRVKSLMRHEAFNIKNPNKVRALIGAFCHHNPLHFHAADGSGYVFLADQVLTLNTLNPQMAARLLGPLSHWRRYDAGRQAAMQRQLERILATPQLSPDVYEITSKSLDH